MRIKKNDGFTLIELLVVIAVIGVLSAIVIPKISGVTDKAKRTALDSASKTLRNNIEIAITENEIDAITVNEGTDASGPASDNWIEFGDSTSASMEQPDKIYIDSDGSASNSIDTTDNTYDIKISHEDLNNYSRIISNNGITAP